MGFDIKFWANNPNHNRKNAESTSIDVKNRRKPDENANFAHRTYFQWEI